MDLDLFYTRFSNKIVPDLSDPDRIVYRNLEGYGVSQGVAFSLAHRFHFPLELKLGGTYQRVHQYRRNEQGSLERWAQLYAPRFAGTFRVNGKFPVLGLSLRWEGRVTGPQRLPSYPEPFSRSEWSPWYSVHDLHIERRMGEAWSLYLGVKNLFDHTQPSPLIDPKDPFGPHFDTEYIYGPLQGRRLYFGIDVSISEAE